jgi:hypothetical protein
MAGIREHRHLLAGEVYVPENNQAGIDHSRQGLGFLCHAQNPGIHSANWFTSNTWIREWSDANPGIVHHATS